MAWQLEVTLDFLLESLQRRAVADTGGNSMHPSASQPPPPPLSTSFQAPIARRECMRALSQLSYENGERLGTRFGDILPLVLRLADPSVTDLETR